MSAAYWRRLWAALRGVEPPPSPTPASSPPPGEAAGPDALAQAEAKIEAMRAEYEALAADGERASRDAAARRINELLETLAPALANVAAMADYVREHEALSADEARKCLASFTALWAELEAKLDAAGTTRIGTAGAAAAFDPARHQLTLPGRAPARVRIRVPGYCRAERVLLKALVAPEEDADE